jgi:hypothetical protein
MAPRNFHEIEKVRAKTYFGAGAHQICDCVAKSTGMTCKNVAVSGERTCRVHGGTAARNRRNGTLGAGCRPDVQYHASLANSVDLRAYLEELDPQMVKKVMAEDHVSARGRKIHELLNRDLRR